MSRDNGNIECVNCIKTSALLKWIALHTILFSVIIGNQVCKAIHLRSADVLIQLMLEAHVRVINRP